MPAVRRTRIPSGTAALLVVILVAAQPAWADPGRDHSATIATGVTLSADPSAVSAGDTVTLSGATTPATSGESVEIRDAVGAVVTTATTAGDGSFQTTFVPAGGVSLHAVWQGVQSPPVDIDVQAVVTVHVANVRLFDTALVSGTALPVRPGATVTVQLLRAGKVVATRSPAQNSTGAFRATFTINDPGGFRARAAFGADDLLEGTRTTDQRTTPLPKMHTGTENDFALLLEQRLVALDYHLVGVNRSFDYRTGDAVLAFRKVQGMARTNSVTPSVWRALASPRSLPLVSTGSGFHIEIDQKRQVLATVQSGVVQAIIHVSTGKPSTPTSDGTFHVYRKIAGYSPHSLYYPSYFDGLRAIHGWPDVPTYAASHGCTRVPYWTAKWIFSLAKIGTKVIVHH